MTTTAKELEVLFAKQREARWRVASTTAEERRRKLRRLGDAIRLNREAIYEAIRGDYGKHPQETELTEIWPTLEEIAHASTHLAKWMKPGRVPTPLVATGGTSHVRYEPLGLVLILSPWNYPFHLALVPLAAAVAAGNCVILRPSDKTPRTARLLHDIISKDFPPDEISVVLGGHEAADKLLELPFDHIFFTGSPAIGRKVMAAAAKNLASVTLELGGKSPAIVDAGANIQSAAESVAWGKFINAGQTCVAPDYVLVRQEAAGDLAEALAARVRRSYGMDARDMLASDSLACLISDASLARLEAAVRETVTAGARILLGGVSDPGRRRLAPTILTDVPNDSAIMQEEIFGPVLPLVPYRTLDEAIAIIRARPKPLAMYIFSRDRSAVEQLLAQTTAGGTTINNTLMHLANPNLPFGGVGESGMGAYHGRHGFECFSHARAVYYQKLPPANKAVFPPYDRTTGFAVQGLRCVTGK